jgi:hypothetical protein
METKDLQRKLAELRLDAAVTLGSDEPKEDFAKRVMACVDSILSVENKPHCRCCGSTNVRYADQQVMFPNPHWAKVQMCCKCGHAENA